MRYCKFFFVVNMKCLFCYSYFYLKKPGLTLFSVLFLASVDMATIADFDIETDNYTFKEVKKTLGRFEFYVAPYKILNFLNIVSVEFNKNLTVEQKNLVARVVHKIITGAFKAIEKTEDADTDESD